MVLFYLYRFFLALLYPFVRIVSLVAVSSSLRERLGFYSPEDREKISIGYNVWLHAASAGEVNAIIPFCRELQKAKPGVRLILTTTSQTGKKLALEKGVTDSVFLAPLDMTAPLKRAFQTFRPVMVLIAETELWPNWLLRTGQNGIPLLLINGRVSDKSFPSYQRLKGFFEPALNCFSACLVQTPLDAGRLEKLGVSRSRLQIMGQMKYDHRAPPAENARKFKEGLRLTEKDVLFTLGSLREGEDDQLLPLLPQLLGFSPDVKILVAPRHLKNAEVYRQKLNSLGIPHVFRSELEKGTRPERVVVLDTVGELSLAYVLSRAAFVGGTLVPIGGHNVMEPALAGVPVCFGSSLQNVSEAAKALLDSGGGRMLRNSAEIVPFFHRFLDASLAREEGQKAHDAVASMRGATEKTVKEVLAHWPIHLTNQNI